MKETLSLIALMSSYYGTDSKVSNTGDATKRLQITSEVISAINEMSSTYPTEINDETLRHVVVELLEHTFKDFLNKQSHIEFTGAAYARIKMILASQGLATSKHYISVAQSIFGDGIKFKDHGVDEAISETLIDKFSNTFGLSSSWLVEGGLPGNVYPRNQLFNELILEGSSFYSGVSKDIEFYVLKSNDQNQEPHFLVFQIINLAKNEDSRVLAKAINPLVYITSSDHLSVLSEPLKEAIGDIQIIKGQSIDFTLFKEIANGQRLVWQTGLLQTSNKIKRDEIAVLIGKKSNTKSITKDDTKKLEGGSH